MNYKTRQPFPHAAYVEGQRNFTYFDRLLTSGLTDEIISSPGDFLYIDQASTGVVSVELNMRQGGTLAPILLAAGGSIECDFASIKLNATAQLNKTVRVIVGNGARIKGGANVQASSFVVTTVDGNKLRTQNAKSFLGHCNAAAGVGQYSSAQLANPAGSGVNVFVAKTTITAETAAGSFALVKGSALAATVLYSAPSKKISAALSNAVMRYETGGSSLFAAPALYAVNTPANTVFPVSFDDPLMLAPGEYLTWCNLSTNSAAAANFDFFEE